jgi:hypothetical protein
MPLPDVDHMVFVSRMLEFCMADAAGVLQLLECVDGKATFIPLDPDEVPQIPILLVLVTPVVVAWEDGRGWCCWIDVPPQSNSVEAGAAGAEEKSERMSCLAFRCGSAAGETDAASGVRKSKEKRSSPSAFACGF